MIRKLAVMLLVGAICVGGVTLALAQEGPYPKGLYPTIQYYEKVTGKTIEKFNEAPGLRAKVAAGELPPVEERLPEDPTVLEPLEEIGQYGGTVHLVIDGPDRVHGDPHCFITPEGILNVGADYKSPVPALAKDWKMSDDGKTFTIFLHKGIKWSDGAPFTVDDILFMFEDYYLNDELCPVKPVIWMPGGEFLKLEKLDDYTLRYHFAAPYPMITSQLIGYQGGCVHYGSYQPKHYLKQFHPRYTPMEKLEKLAKEEGFEFWYQLFQAKIRGGSGGITINPEAPTLNPFFLKDKGTDFMLYERNPYYWKVDTAGNQLPYIDRVHLTIVSDPEMVSMKIVTGAVDFAGAATSLENYPAYQQSAEKGDYRVLLYLDALGAEFFYNFNLCSEDPVRRKIFRDVRFRRAMSLAVDRDEINETLFFGLAEPRQNTVLSESIYYEPEFATAYTEYAPERANALLDEMGLDKRDGEGWRLQPDGKRLTLTIEYWAYQVAVTPLTELIAEYWQAVGVRTILKEEERGLLTTGIRANKVDVSLWWSDRCLDFKFEIEPFPWVPMNTGDESLWSYKWAQWYVTGGKEGEEPTEEAKRLLKLWEELISTVDIEKRIPIGKEILRSNAENVWTIGTVGNAPKPVIVRNNLRNIPETGIYAYIVMRLTSRYPETFFFKQK